MSYRFLLSCYLLVRFVSAIPCQENFESFLNVCVNISASTLTFCEAQSYCYAFGGQLIHGANFLPILSATKIPSTLWIGLTDLLDERNSSREGWTWSDGSVIPSSETLRWGAQEPDGSDSENDRDCICLSQNGIKLRDTGCYSRNNALCQPSMTWERSTAARFEMSAQRSLHSIYDFAKGACLEELVGMASLLDCAVNCLSITIGWCVAVYFSGQSNSCLLVMFQDAHVDLTALGGGSWQKFIIRR